MALRSQMHYMGDLVLLHHATNRGLVAQIHTLETVTRILLQPRKTFEMARVGEAVKIDQQLKPGAVDDMPDQIRADEASSAGDKKIHIAKLMTRPEVMPFM